jgi:tRNA threonylcarbamoyladenosine biosynthesis protein TsaB
MKTLVLDTCHKYIVVGCFEDDQCLSSWNEWAWKQQSERFFEALNTCMDQAGWECDDLDQIVLTEGPGSYTGERIAMTFAKVLCTQKPIDLYTIPTYLIFAGQNSGEVILDARSNRVYCGTCENGRLVSETIKTLDQIKEDKDRGINIMGDTYLIGEENKEIDLAANFIAVKCSWKKVANVHTLTPHYLKNKEELVK